MPTLSNRFSSINTSMRSRDWGPFGRSSTNHRPTRRRTPKPSTKTQPPLYLNISQIRGRFILFISLTPRFSGVNLDGMISPIVSTVLTPCAKLLKQCASSVPPNTPLKWGVNENARRFTEGFVKYAGVTIDCDILLTKLNLEKSGLYEVQVENRPRNSLGRDDLTMPCLLGGVLQTRIYISRFEVGKVLQDFSRDMPPAIISSTWATVIRMPRMQGRPPQISGSMTMRSNAMIE